MSIRATPPTLESRVLLLEKTMVSVIQQKLERNWVWRPVHVPTTSRRGALMVTNPKGLLLMWQLYDKTTGIVWDRTLYGEVPACDETPTEEPGWCADPVSCVHPPPTLR